MDPPGQTEIEITKATLETLPTRIVQHDCLEGSGFNEIAGYAPVECEGA